MHWQSTLKGEHWLCFNTEQAPDVILNSQT